MKKRDLFPMNQMEHKFSKIFIFSNQYNFLEIQECYSMSFIFTFTYLKSSALTHKLILESMLKLKNAIFLHYKTV